MTIFLACFSMMVLCCVVHCFSHRLDVTQGKLWWKVFVEKFCHHCFSLHASVPVPLSVLISQDVYKNGKLKNEKNVILTRSI